MSSLSCHTYRRASLVGQKQWLPSPPSKPSLGNAQLNPVLTVATLNVWFDNLHHSDIRFPAILDLICELDPDVVCLQEVNDSFLACLRGHKGVQRRYSYFGGGGDGAIIGEATWYGCLMLFNLSTVIPHRQQCSECSNSSQGRHILSATVSGIKGQRTYGIADFTVCTAHIESPVPQNPNREERQRQLHQAKNLMSHSGGIFCGDTNVSPAEEAEFPASLDWWRTNDSWLLAGHDANTPTFGITYAVKEEPKRLDRMFVFQPLRDVKYEVVKAERFATEELNTKGAPKDVKMYYSDHVGVLTTVRQVAA